VSALTDLAAAKHQVLAELEERTGTRCCTGCGDIRPLDDFHRDRRNRLGRATRCKPCERKRALAYSRTVDPAKRNDAVRRHRLADPRGYNEKRRARYAEDPTPTLVYNANRRAARAAAGSFTVDEWLALLAQCGAACLACGATERIEPDHVVPISWGGSGMIGNVQPLCRSCNAAKGDRHATDYRKG